MSDTDTKKVTVQIDGRKKKTGGTASKKSKEITTHLVRKHPYCVQLRFTC